MLVLNRRVGESIHIGDGIVIQIVAINGKCVRVGIVAPKKILIKRSELTNFVQKSKPTAVGKLATVVVP